MLIVSINSYKSGNDQIKKNQSNKKQEIITFNCRLCVLYWLTINILKWSLYNLRDKCFFMKLKI